MTTFMLWVIAVVLFIISTDLEKIAKILEVAQ